MLLKAKFKISNREVRNVWHMFLKDKETDLETHKKAIVISDICYLVSFAFHCNRDQIDEVFDIV